MVGKNYFIIQNGTQLLNAIEYVEFKEFRQELNVLIIVSTTDIIYDDLQVVIEGSEHFNEVHYIFPKFILKLNRYRIGRICSLMYAKRKIISAGSKKINELIIGNYQNVFCKYFVKKSLSTKVVIVDDGPSTIDIFELTNRRLSRFNQLIESLLKVKKYRIEADVIFTRFSKQLIEKSDLEVKRVQIIENDFLYLKQSIDQKEKSLERLFVGYPFVEEEIFSTDEYVELLIKIKKKVGDFIYIPHRRETQESLTCISKFFHIKNLGMPFELYLYKSETYPAEIIGFFSTVLFNVNQMFGKKISLKYIRIDKLDIVHINNLKNLYDEIDKIAKLVFKYKVVGY